MSEQYTDFDSLIESITSKLNLNGVSVGAVVKIVSNYKSQKDYKDLPAMAQKHIDTFKTNYDDHIVRVIDLKHPASAPDSRRVDSALPPTFVDVSPELAPGLFAGFSLTLPTSIVEVQNYGVNLPDVPKHMIDDRETNIEPEPADKFLTKQTEDTRKTNKGKTSEEYHKTDI